MWVQLFRSIIELGKLSKNGGEEPTWSLDGTEVYYRNKEDWMAVEIIRGSELKIGATRRLLGGPYLNAPGHSYDYDPNRESFLMRERSEEEESKIRIITNGFDRLGR